MREKDEVVYPSPITRHPIPYSRHPSPVTRHPTPFLRGGLMSTQSNEREAQQSALEAGTEAPDFTLADGPDRKVTLKDLRGRPVILAFYPADWSPVCGDQMALYNEVLAEFERYNAQLLGISVDGAWCHAAFAGDRKLHFPLLADFEPKGAVARRYGA